MPAQSVKRQVHGAQVKKVEPEKNLFSWKAPGRPFKKRDREFWIKLIAIVGLIGFVVYIVEGLIPVLLAISLMFLFYVLSTVEPEEIEYKITNRGVKIADKSTGWDVINRYWFAKRSGSDLLVLDLTVIPGRLDLVIGSKDKDSIRKALKEYLNEEKTTPSGFDKTADWFSKKL